MEAPSSFESHAQQSKLLQEDQVNQIAQNPFIVLEDNLPEIFQEELLELKIAEHNWFFKLGDITNKIWKWCCRPA